MFRRFLFGDEAKLQFKSSSTDGIARLYSEPQIPKSDARYWRKYVRLFDSANDVFDLLSVADVKKSLERYPENIASLVEILIAHLESLKHDPLFSPPPTRGTKTAPSNQGYAGTFDASRSIIDASSRGAAVLGSFVPNLGTSSQTRKSGTDIHEESAEDSRDRTKEALNCCRVLSRVLPIIMEGESGPQNGAQTHQQYHDDASSSTSFEHKLLWVPLSDDEFRNQGMNGQMEPRRKDESAIVGNDTQDQFVIAEESDDDDEQQEHPRNAKEDLQSDPLRNSEPTHSHEGRKGSSLLDTSSLGSRLTTTAVELLFYAGFTIPWTEDQVTHQSEVSVIASRRQYTIWEKGVGSSTDLPGCTKEHESHRSEVLRLFLVLLSKTIYVAPDEQVTFNNPPLRQVTTALDRSITLPLLCSLLNVSLAWMKSEGWFSSLSNLPAGLVKDRLHPTGEDCRQMTVSLALQILNVLLSYDPPASNVQIDSSDRPHRENTRPSLLSTSSSQSVAPVGRTQNQFRVYIGKLHRQSDFSLLVEGIFTIISQRNLTASLLGSVAGANQATDTSGSGPNIPDSLIILWRLSMYNSKFRTYLLDERSPELVSHLLYHALNNKDNVARQGLVRLVTFMLQDLSCDQAFAVHICKSGSGVRARVSGGHRWGLAGGSSTVVAPTSSTQHHQSSTGADVLIQSVYALISTTRSTLTALYAPLIITLTNVSPFMRNLSILSANRLVALFKSFSSPSFLLADEGNPRLVYYLTECLNNIIQYGLLRNPNLTYALVRNHASVENLANFTLRRGIAEIRRTHRRAGLVNTTPPLPPTQANERKYSGQRAMTGLQDEQGSSEPPHVSSNTVEEHNPLENTLQTQEAGKPLDTPKLPASVEPPASEKARGKMRQHSGRAGSTEEANNGDGLEELEDEETRLVNGFSDEELSYAASLVGRNGFVSSQDWVTSWHKG